jgi:ABC-type multidrug transport system fused ATPase/permease subunit
MKNKILNFSKKQLDKIKPIVYRFIKNLKDFFVAVILFSFFLLILSILCNFIFNIFDFCFGFDCLGYLMERICEARSDNYIDYIFDYVILTGVIGFIAFIFFLIFVDLISKSRQTIENLKNDWKNS